MGFARVVIIPQASIIPFSADHFFLLDGQLLLSDMLPLYIDFQSEVKVKGNIFSRMFSNSSLQILNTSVIGRLERVRIRFETTCVFKERLIANTMAMNMSNFVRRMNAALSFVHLDGKKQFKQHLLLRNRIVIRNHTIKIHNFNEYTSLSNNALSILKIHEARGVTNVIIFDMNFDAYSATIKKPYIIERPKWDSHNETQMKYYDFKSLLVKVFDSRDRIYLITIHESVQFESNNIFVGTINKLNLKFLFGIFVSKAQSNGKSVEVRGEKMFVSELNTLLTHINEFNKQVQTRNWTENALRQQRTEMEKQQVIDSTGWQFMNIISDDCQIERPISGIYFTTNSRESPNIIFIDGNRLKTITISSDLSFSNDLKTNIKSDLKCYELRPCKANSFLLETVHLSQTLFYELNMVGNVKNLKKIKDYHKISAFSLLEMGMPLNSGHDIEANITFITKTRVKFLFNKISSIQNQQDIIINGINIIAIFNDAVFQTNNYPSGKFQTVSFGSLKEFVAMENIFGPMEPIFSGAVKVRTMNAVDITLLKNNLFHRSSIVLLFLPWQKVLFLNGPVTHSIYIKDDETINGINLENVFFVYLNHLNQRSSITFVRLDESSKQNTVVSGAFVDINLVNELSLGYFIGNRFQMLKKLPIYFDNYQMIDGFLTFENFILDGEATKIDHINDVLCEEVVSKLSNDNQRIIGSKDIFNVYPTLYIGKPSHTWKINHFEFVALYTKTTLLNHEQFIEHLFVRNPYQLQTRDDTIIWQNFINPIGVSQREITVLRATLANLTTDSEQDIRKHRESGFHKMSNIENDMFQIDYRTFNDIAPLNASFLCIEQINEFKDVCPTQYYIQTILESKRRLIIYQADALTRILSVHFRRNYFFQIRTEFLVDSIHVCKLSQSVDADSKTKSVAYLNHRQIFSLTSEIVESFHVFNVNETIYIVLHVFNTKIYIYRQDKLLKWCKIRSLKLYKNSDSNCSSRFNIRIIKGSKYNLLAVAKSYSKETNLDLKKNSDARVTIYQFNYDNETFNFIQELYGNYDIISASIRSSDIYLILAKRGETYMDIFKAKSTEHFMGNQPFSLKRKDSMYFKHGIIGISTFRYQSEFSFDLFWSDIFKTRFFQTSSMLRCLWNPAITIYI